MGIVERRIREKEERRKLILETTKRLILERGVDAFSMQDVADAVELSKATLYLYFDSKEAIFREIFRDATDYFVEYVEERMPADASGLESLRVLWGSYLSIYGESGDDIVLIGIWRSIDSSTLINGNPSSEYHDSTRPMVDLIAKTLKRGIADGTLDSDIDPERIACTCLLIATACIDNLARLPREQRDSRLIREELRNTFELLLRGLAAPTTDRKKLSLPNA